MVAMYSCPNLMLYLVIESIITDLNILGVTSLPTVGLQEQCCIVQVGITAQTADYLPVFLEDLQHFNSGWKKAE